LGHSHDEAFGGARGSVVASRHESHCDTFGIVQRVIEVDTRQIASAPTGAKSKEDTMRKVIVILLFAAFAVAGLALSIALAQEKAPAAAKESRWHGIIVRIDKDASTMDVRRGNVERKIHWDSSTKWTEGTKTIDMSDFKEGADVICLGAYPSGSVVMNATRIDLRRK